MTSRPMMRTVVVQQPGEPSVLLPRDAPRPEARDGWTLIRVMAFGLNRSELFTRRGLSPTVNFPRVLGIECVGTVERSLDPLLPDGTVVAAAMGGMGRRFDGSYAEFTLLPTNQLIPVRSQLPWPALAALPESYLTAYGSLETLSLGPGHRLLIRAGSSSIGMAALSMTAGRRLDVACTTRNPAKAENLRQHGAHHVVLDQGDGISDGVRGIWPDGADRVLDLVGGEAVRDSLRALAPEGRVCNAGILSDTWTIREFEPLEDIPSGATLTTFSSSSINTGDWSRVALQGIVNALEAESFRLPLDRVFDLDELADAHRYMEANRATGKVVGVVPHT